MSERVVPPHPHVVEAMVTSAPVAAGVPLRGLLERARARGMVTLPPFITVKIVQQLCRGMQQAPQPGEVSLDSVALGYDGKLQVRSRWEVGAAAIVLDQLLGDTLDAELVRIIGETRLPESTALTLEQRLGHWLVKQHQLFPRADLVAELMAWLYPAEVETPVSEQVATWLDEQCTGPVLEEPGVRTAPGGTRWWPMALGLFIVAIGAAVLVAQAEQPVRPSEVTAPVIRPRPAPPAEVVAPAPAPETLPRWGTGAPAVVKLSSIVHGVALETAGFSVSAPSSRWAVKTVSMVPRVPAPAYASLFVAEFDANHRSTGLRRVGTQWLVLTQPEARFFALQTDQPPGEGSFGLALGLPQGAKIVEQPELQRANVLTDAMTGLEYRRFVLDGLDPARSYVITQQGARPPVVVTATIPRAAARGWTGAGFQQRGAPLDQALLQGVPVSVKGASRISFVVLTTKDAPEQLTSVEVTEAWQPRALEPPPTVGALTEPMERLLAEGRELMATGDFRGAQTVFQQCLSITPGQPECRQLLGEASSAQDLKERQKKHAR